MLNIKQESRIPDAQNLAVPCAISSGMETEAEFRQFHAELVGLTVEQHRRYLHVEPCECDHPDCIGWATIPMSQWRREQREARSRA